MLAFDQMGVPAKLGGLNRGVRPESGQVNAERQNRGLRQWRRGGTGRKAGRAAEKVTFQFGMVLFAAGQTLVRERELS
jgi:hypothetical protein